MIPSRIAKVAAKKTSPTSSSTTVAKQLFILRHGQATHNPRAEAARAKGCSHDEFLELMRQDDSLDSELTELGRSQAQSVHDQSCSNWNKAADDDNDPIQLVVSSPLSRAIQTAEGAVPFVKHRICVETFREINGWLLNAKRRQISDLKRRFPSWDFSDLSTEEDTLWTPELETHAACSERGYQGLCWILQRPEDSIFLVCHGGILRFTMNQHALVKMVDGRSCSRKDTEQQEGTARFGNCELRRYSIEWEPESNDVDSAEDTAAGRTIILTELDQAD